MRNGDKKESPAVNAMLRAADICEGYYADEVWTNTLARGAAFDLSRALRSEATKIAAEEYSSASSATEVDSRSRLRRIAAQKGEPAPDFSETSARDAALEEAAQECDAYVRACRDDEDSSAASDLAGHIRRRKGTPSSATLPNTEQSVALPAGHSRRGEGGTANAAIAPQVGSQGPAPFSFDKRCLHGIDEMCANCDPDEPLKRTARLPASAIDAIRAAKQFFSDHNACPIGMDEVLERIARAAPSTIGTPVVWFRKESGIYVYYETEAWPNMTPLYLAHSSARTPTKLELAAWAVHHSAHHHTRPADHYRVSMEAMDALDEALSAVVPSDGGSAK